MVLLEQVRQRLTAAHAATEVEPYAGRILDAARERILEFGLRRTSLDDIARAAGVGRATLFRRFPSRDVLVAALFTREAQRAIAAIDAELHDIADAEELLVASARAVIREIMRNRMLARLIGTDTDLVAPLLTDRGGAILAMGRQYIAGRLGELAAHGARFTAEPELIGDVLARLVVSLAVNRETVIPLDDEGLERVVRALFVPMVLERKGSAKRR